MSTSRHVLIIASDEKMRARVSSIVASVGARPDAYASVEELAPGPLPHALAILVLEEGADKSGELIGKLSERLEGPAQIVAVASPIDLARLSRLLTDDKCSHVVGSDDGGMPILANLIRRYHTGEIFGIEHHIGSPGDVRLLRLRDYAGRTSAIDEVVKHAEELGIRSKVRAQIGQVAEELLMNALYDAPVDEQGRLVFGDVELKERTQRPSPRPVSIRSAASATHFLVAVRDRYGRLDKGTVVRYLDKCLHGPAQIDRKKLGAGLGLYIVLSAASQVSISVAPGMITEVVCAFERRGARQSLQGFSMFVHPGGK